MNKKESEAIKQSHVMIDHKINLIFERQEIINDFIMKNLSVFQFEELVKELNQFDKKFRENLK